MPNSKILSEIPSLIRCYERREALQKTLLAYSNGLQFKLEVQSSSDGKVYPYSFIYDANYPEIKAFHSALVKAIEADLAKWDDKIDGQLDRIERMRKEDD